MRTAEEVLRDAYDGVDCFNGERPDCYAVAQACLAALEAAGWVVVPVAELAELHCPEAAGFEGPDTYFACGKCAICRAKAMLEARPKP